ncbi:NmrA family NAD(P)-binding protein [Streptomyces sp. SBC-4]|nr:NmrA family NAD(P)-binding protein [Streptomyces sp. SBC-4]MDV5143953.1 NmrA family NAD(P)-binding protein [Streptomyces sp. SBC-4]
MTEKKIITVIGATGRQGGGLVRALLADQKEEFAVRAVTRHPDGEPAQELQRLGVTDIVRADMDDPPSLAPAFAHAYGAFFVTNFWEHMSAEREKVQALALARAASHAGVQHAIWSTLEDTRACVPLDDDRMPTLQEHYKVPHFDGKAEADRYFTDEGVPTTFLRTTFYWRTCSATSLRSAARTAPSSWSTRWVTTGCRASPSRTSAGPRWPSSAAAPTSSPPR